MNLRYFLLAALLCLLAGCAAPATDPPLIGIHDIGITGVSATGSTVRRDGSFAFLPEPNLRPEKQAFYDRMRGYLTGAGYRLVDANASDYLLQVNIVPLSEFLALAPSTSSYVPPPGAMNLFVFMFEVYGPERLRKPQCTPLWRGRVVGVELTQRAFRAREKELVLETLSHVGSDYHGRYIPPEAAGSSAPTDGTPAPKPTPSP